jgi:hypothetical protein
MNLPGGIVAPHSNRILEFLIYTPVSELLLKHLVKPFCEAMCSVVDYFTGAKKQVDQTEPSAWANAHMRICQKLWEEPGPWEMSIPIGGLYSPYLDLRDSFDYVPDLEIEWIPDWGFYYLRVKKLTNAQAKIVNPGHLRPARHSYDGILR